jgi:uncharacterized protein (TIGR02145 family)
MRILKLVSVLLLSGQLLMSKNSHLTRLIYSGIDYKYDKLMYFNEKLIYRTLIKKNEIEPLISGAIGTFHGKEHLFVRATATPTVTTLAPVPVDGNSFISGGEVISDGGAAVTGRGVIWDTIPKPTVTLPTKTSDGTGVGKFSSVIKGLIPGRKYYFRAYASNAAGVGYGRDTSFVPIAIAPTVKTVEVSAISKNSAECGGIVISNGGANISSRGVVWSTSPQPSIALSTKTNDSIGVGSFKSMLNQLQERTSYYVRAYAANNIGVSYGEEIKFNTLSLPTVLTLEVDSVSFSSAIYSGNITFDGGSEILERGVILDTLPNPTIQGVDEGPIALPLSTYSYQTDSSTTRETDVLSYGNLSKESRFEKISVLFNPTGTPQEITVEIKDGYVYYQHCIILFTEEEFEHKKLEKGNIISINNYRWPNGIIPFIIDPSIKDSSKIFDAIEQINIHTNLCLKPRGTETNYVKFRGDKPGRCASSVGMINGEQPIHAGEFCSFGSVIHEILHAAGMWHEQSRPDRDNYIRINYGNIHENYFNAFEIPNDIDVVGKYDYESIMHYGSHFFSKNSLPTIEVLSPPAPPGTTIGQREGLSSGDIETINTIYTKKDCSSAKYLVNGKGKGFFSGKLTGLKPGTKYYIKAYAKNTAGISYGQDVSFTTSAFLPSIEHNSISRRLYDGFRVWYKNLSDGGLELNNVGVLVDTVPIPLFGLSKVEYGKPSHYENGRKIWWPGHFFDISGLKSNVKYYYRFFATNKKGTAYSETNNIILDSPLKGQVSTISIDSIKANTVICNGKVEFLSNDLITDYGFVWDKQKNPTLELSFKKITSRNGESNFFSFFNTIEGLSPNTTYYIKAFIKNAAGISYGSELTFSTKAAALPPIVKSIEVKNIKSNSFEFIGEVTADNESTVYERGVVWDTTKTPLLNNINRLKTGNGIGVYNVTVSSLNPNKPYFVRAYAINSAGIAYGDVIELKTLQIQLPSVKTFLIEQTWADSAKVIGSVIDDGGAEVTYGIEWAIYDFINNDYKLVGSKIEGKGIAVFSSVVRNLKPGTPYYVRVFGKNNAGISYGNYISLFTKRSNPILITEVLRKDATYMECRVVIKSDGGWGSPVYRGVIIDTIPNAAPNVLNKYYNGIQTDTFYVWAYNLKPNKKYYIRGFLDYFNVLYFSSEISDSTLIDWPQVQTSNMSSITETAAVIEGNVLSTGGDSNITRGVIWSTSHNLDVSLNTKTNEKGENGIYSSLINGLNPGTIYYVRAYASNSRFTSYGHIEYFKTLINIPDLITTQISNLSSNSVTSGGTVTSDDGAQVTERGVVWSRSIFPTVSLTTKTINGSGIGSFSSVVTGLLPNTKYYLRAYATNINGTNYGSQIEFTTKSGLPELTTKKPTSIIDSSAICGGDIISAGNSNIISRGVVWSLSPAPTIGLTTKTSDGSGVGLFNSNIRGLSAGRRYYVRAYATNSLGTNYGQEEIIVTPIGLPTVTTTKTESIRGSTAMSGGNVTSTGGSLIVTRGVVWGTSPGPTISLNTKTNDGTGLGIYTSSIRGLNPGTTYYLRAYATNSLGTSYGGEEIIFIPIVPTGITTTKPTSITSTTAISGGTATSAGGTSILTRGVVWGTSPGPTISLNTKTNDGSGPGTYTSFISGLNPGTTYYVRAYVTNSFGTSYGGENSFVTNNVEISPEVLLTVPQYISAANAISGGEVLSDGGSTVTSRGVVWSTTPNPTINLITKTVDGSGLGAFVSNITGLSLDVTYYVRAYATNSVGTKYSSEFQIKLSLPTVIPLLEGSTFSGNQIKQGANVIFSGGSPVTARGIVWGTNPQPTIELNTKTMEGNGLGSFIGIANFQLNNCTEYYVRAYATNIGGTSYSSPANCYIFDNISAVSTSVISAVTTNSAVCGGDLFLANCMTNIVRGVIWSTSPDPTIGLATKTENENGSGVYVSNITGLAPNTTYYIRAYAKIKGSSNCGISFVKYGVVRTFTTASAFNCGLSTITDIDGNTYNTVQIGTQCWTKENLRVTKYSDGISIPLDNSGGTAGNGAGQTWGSRTTGARTIYEHSASNLTTYGYLYNWYAAKGIATTYNTSYKNLCPAGWHVPSDGEWTALTTFLGGESIAGGKMKSTGTTLWASPNTGATNVSGFTGLPGGFRNNDGRFLIISDRACFWGADDNASRRELYSNGGSVNSSTSSKSVGFSVRCLRDNSSSGLQPDEKTNLVFLDSFPTNTFYSKREVFEKEMNLEKAFIVFPNPSSGRVTIRFNNIKTNIPRKMEISDEMGRRLREFNLSDMTNQLDFDLSSLPGSVYFLRVFYDNGILVEKLFKW